MTEYWITIQVQVPARNIDEAVVIAKHLELVIKNNVSYKIIDAECSGIEDAGIGQ